MLFVLFISLYTTRITLHVLGVEDYGVYNVVVGFVSLFAFMNTAMANIIQRAYNFEDQNDPTTHITTYNTAIQVQAVIAIIIFLALETFGLWYINHILVVPTGRLSAVNWVYQFSTISLVLVIMQLPFSSLIMARERFDYYALVSIVDAIFRLLLVIILPRIPNDKLVLYGALSLIISIANFLLYFVYCKFAIKGNHFKFLFDKKQFFSLFSLSGWTMFDIFSFMLKGQGLNMLMNSFFGPVVNAARGIAFQIMNAINGFSTNILTAFRPQLIQSYAETNYARTKELFFSMSKYAFVLLAALSIPLILNIDFVLFLWLGEDFPAYTQSFTILVLVDMALSSLNTPITQLALATGKIKCFQIVRSIVVSLVLPVSWIALRFGTEPQSVFIICICLTIINQPISLWLLKRVFQYDYSDYINSVIKPCFLFVTFATLVPLVISYLIQDNRIKIVVTCIASLLLSIIIGYYVVLTKTERSAIICSLKRLL